MAQRLLSKTEFARLKGVSQPAISQAIRGPLSPALVGDRIDANHPAAIAYLAPKRTAAADRAPTSSAKRASPAPAAPTARRPKRGDPPPRMNPNQGLEQLAEMPGYADMSIRELVARWGTFRTFADLLDALKTMEDIRKTHLHNEETEGSLISRELVQKHVFGAIEETNRRLLTDSPRTIAGRLLGMANGGATLEEAERTVRELISSQLKLVKAQASKVLRAPQAAVA